MVNPADRSSSIDESADDESPLEEIAAGITIGLILTVAFGLLALGVPWFWIAFPIGFAGVLPAVMGLVKLYERRRHRQTAPGGRRSEANSSDARDALETLRERYARGELTDEQFEQRLDRLLETETLEDVERRDRARGDRDRDRDRDRGRGRDRERERDSAVELE
ncbi:SHOCT domain-containing protein [Halomontanus rarus]|uniref:SHOCT domain-containing protein n=1 Tax=Halomontanus rarus TaxID=3034020 RepID=UPI001A993943